MMRALVLLLALFAAAGCSGGAIAPAARPNVVVIMIDTLRPDRLPCYGYTNKTAPFITKLAREGVKFRRAHSTSTWTAPATASLFTSLYPPQHGVLEGFFVNRTRAVTSESGAPAKLSLNRLPDTLPTLPELFAAAGWRTFGAAANVNITGRIGFDRGFEHFRDWTGPEHGKGAPADQVLAGLREWKGELSRAPYFLYLHLNDVHSPWRDREQLADAPLDELTRSKLAYEAEIRFTDRVLERAYAEFGWSENTLVCVVTDHGEEFMEHGQLGHNDSLHTELLRIAWILHWPERWQSGRVVDGNVSIVDVVPTLARLCGLPPNAQWEGQSLVDAIDELEADDERALFAHRVYPKQPEPLWAVIEERWKLIQRGERRALYDMATDPGELVDLAARELRRVEELKSRLDAFRARARPLGSRAVEIELDANELRKLQELGYGGEK